MGNIYNNGKISSENSVLGSQIKKANPSVAKLPKLTPKKTPTPTIKPTLKPTSVPTSAPTQTPSPSPIATPAVTQAPANGESDLLKQVNDFRMSVGLSAVQNDPYTCGLANTRANEITSSFSHDGFNNRIGSHSLPYPSYSYVNENIAMNSDINQVVPSWIASPGHNENMRKDTPYVCIARSGDYYAYEGWKP